MAANKRVRLTERQQNVMIQDFIDGLGEDNIHDIYDDDERALDGDEDNVDMNILSHFTKMCFKWVKLSIDTIFSSFSYSPLQ